MADDDATRFEVEGNRLVPLADARTRREALLQLIAGARRTLRLLYYIFRDDALGREVRDALAAAAARGVRVALLIDGFGSEATDDAFFRPLIDAGAEVRRFHPRWGRRYLLRNHQKLALADEERIIVGGFNIAAAYFDEGADGWRDFGLLVEGPAAAPMADYFDLLLAWTRKPRAKVRTLRRALKRWSEREGRVRWLLGGPAHRLSPWARAVRGDLMTARRCDLIAAYFAPNPGMLRRIERVARRNRDAGDPDGGARLLTAAKSDNVTTIAAARHCYARLLRRGVRVFEYQPARLHTKLLVIDDAVHVGSANLDMRSLFLNLELMLRIEDAGFAAAMRRYVDGETAESREITPAAYRAHAGWLDRLRWRLSYYVVAVLDPALTRRLNFGTDGSELG